MQSSVLPCELSSVLGCSSVPSMPQLLPLPHQHLKQGCDHHHQQQLPSMPPLIPLQSPGSNDVMIEEVPRNNPLYDEDTHADDSTPQIEAYVQVNLKYQELLSLISLSQNIVINLKYER